MSARSTSSTLPLHTLGSKSVVWWGMVGLVAIEVVVFSGLIATYFYLKLGNTDWPPAGIPEPDLLLPTLNTLVLIASGIAMAVADRGVRRGRQGQLKVGQALALLLAAGFLALKAYEYAGFDYDWSTHVYGSITFTITGFHAAHVLSVLLKGLVVFAMALRGMFTPERRLALQVNGLYWQFVVIVWLPLYFTLYWGPRL